MEIKISKEIKTAILVITSICLFVWGYNFLKGKDLLSNYKTFYVQYDNVEGLAKAAPVTLNGLVIGKITDIKLENTTGKSIVEMQITTDFPISKSSLANIYEPGLIGGKQIQIVPNMNDKNLAEDKDHLNGGVVLGMANAVIEKLTPLQQKAEKMLVSTDELVRNLNSMLDAKNKENIAQILENLKKTLADLSKVSQATTSLLTDNKAKINGTLANMNKVSSDFSKISDSLSKVNLAQTVKNLEQSLASVDKIMADVQSGKGSMGKLMKDETLYNNMAKTSKELELLLEDVRLNPTRYVNVSVFGKKNKPYVAPVKDTISTKDKI
ncbi:MAG: MlaD family protein [Flavobacterium sp.]